MKILTEAERLYRVYQSTHHNGDRPNVLRRYNNSTKGRECRARYKKSPNGLCVASAATARRRAKCRGSNSAILKIYKRCLSLRRWFDVVVDHIIPLAKGGAHSAANLQIIYRKENCEKGIRLDYRPSVVFL